MKGNINEDSSTQFIQLKSSLHLRNQEYNHLFIKKNLKMDFQGNGIKKEKKK